MLASENILQSKAYFKDQGEIPWLLENEDNSNDFDAACEVIKNKQKVILDKLQKTGAILLRGFSVNNYKRFERAISILGKNHLNYIDGNSPRTKLSSKVYTSTEFPKEYFISMHNELSYSHTWPKVLYFCCETAPQEKGNTLIADCRKVLADLDQDIVAEFTERKVTYFRYLHGGYGFGPSWQETFESDDKSIIEEYCQKSNIQFQWGDDDCLSLNQTVPAVIEHPITGEKVWFCQADQFHPSNLPKKLYDGIVSITQGARDKFPTYSTFGDGGEISLEKFKEISNIFSRHTIYFPWEKGDLLVIDNVLIAHGRAPFSGSRKILVAMS